MDVLRFWKHWSWIQDPPHGRVTPWEIRSDERYGDAINRAMESLGRFILLEHDIAMDRHQLDALEATAALFAYQTIVVANYTLWDGTPRSAHRVRNPEGVLAWHTPWMGSPSLARVGFGAIYIPPTVWRALWPFPGPSGDYPILDTIFSQEAEKKGLRMVLSPAHAVHLHY